MNKRSGTSVEDLKSEAEAESKIDEGITSSNEGRQAVKVNKKMKLEKVVVDVSGMLQSFLERQHEMHKEMLNEEIRLLKRKLQMKERALKWEFEERIMSKDLSKLAPNVREKYKIMQARILKEWEGRCLSGEANDSGESNK